jgi:hypothetical protein
MTHNQNNHITILFDKLKEFGITERTHSSVYTSQQFRQKVKKQKEAIRDQLKAIEADIEKSKSILADKQNESLSAEKA